MDPRKQLMMSEILIAAQNTFVGVRRELQLMLVFSSASYGVFNIAVKMSELPTVEKRRIKA